MKKTIATLVAVTVLSLGAAFAQDAAKPAAAAPAAAAPAAAEKPAETKDAKPAAHKKGKKKAAKPAETKDAKPAAEAPKAEEKK